MASRHYPITEELIARWVKMWNDGLNVAEIAEAFPSYERTTITKRLKKALGVERLEHRHRYSRTGNGGKR